MGSFGDLIELVTEHSKRLGAVNIDDAVDNFLIFAETVGEMESDGNITATNIPQNGKEATSAKGMYQFVDASVQPAINRVVRRIHRKPWMDKDILDMDRNEQTILFLGDILEKTAVVDGKKVPGLGDTLLKKVMVGDREAMKKAYYTLHHTEPDKATKTRAEKLFR